MMRMPPPAAVVFDAYGTLFDYASAAARSTADLGDAAPRLTALWRDKQLQYTWLRSLQGRHADFWQVTSDALDYALASLNLADPKLHARLMESYLTLDPFPEVPAVLQRLKQSGARTAILSNGSPKMLTAAVAAAHLEPYLDAVLSVEEVGVFKPHPKVYQLAATRLALEPREIWFVSANAWDAWSASSFGLRTAWCNRYHQHPEHLHSAPEVEVLSLTELPFL